MNVQLLPEPLKPVAAVPLISRSLAFTPTTALLNVTVMFVRFVKLPGTGTLLKTTGGATFALTVTFTVADVCESPTLSVATAVSE